MQRRKLNNQTNSLQARRRIKFFYERKKILCDKCDLRQLSSNDIKKITKIY